MTTRIIALLLLPCFCFGGVDLVPATVTPAELEAVIEDHQRLYTPMCSQTSTPTTTTIALSGTNVIYHVTVTSSTALAMDYSGVDFSKGAANWQTWLKVATTDISVTLPSVDVVGYLETPFLSTTEANQVLQIAWQAWVEGTTTNVQAHLYGRFPND